jgi:hypothetical protein
MTLTRNNEEAAPSGHFSNNFINLDFSKASVIRAVSKRLMAGPFVKRRAEFA